MKNLVQELKRRKVFRVAVMYTVVAWVLIQVTSTILPTFDAPEWVNQAITLLLLVGLPVALILAWAYELTPEGIKVDLGLPEEVSEESQPATAQEVFQYVAQNKPSIAILPFKSLGADSNQDFLADGIRFGIQASLVQISGLFLVNAAALNAYRNTEKSNVDAGVELDVRYILDGTVQQSGDKIRATVQLTDVIDKQTIWAEHYDGILEDVFKLQDEITREVVSSLNVKLLDNEIARVWFDKLTSAESREYYYRGSAYFYELNKDDNARAREMFEQLYRVEPDSVIGPGNIAITHWIDGFFGWTEAAENSMQQAEKWAIKAMEFDVNNGLGHAVFGYIQLLKGNYEEALNISAAGVKLRSSCPVAHGLLALILNYMGNSKSAVDSVKQALHLERIYPIWLINLLATAYRDSGELNLSIPTAEESMRLTQSNEARLILCSNYERLARPQEAKTMADDIAASDPAFTLTAFAQSQHYKDTATLDALIANLRSAGLPE